ncbi:ABC transporter substrate-binding protein [Saccharomonospora iraqiensis]|uniref:ABC transporter substrate-binding protein n=1 Tax=Saccharomonospora iraqiensis TaxID=52698 RepID=UPI00047C06C1|nr:ABC transporter substrate-binding protein [Saccharomonospora iraqiensis]
MTGRATSRWWPVVLAAVLVLGTACSPGGDRADAGAGTAADGGTDYRTGLRNTDPGAATPDRGGTFTMAAFSEPRVLDPARTIVAGSTGGVALAAVYDVLMRWDSEREEVVPRLAESLEPDDGFTTWTLRLRDGVRFSDGTPLDAAAVTHSIERYVDAGADDAAVWTSAVRDMRTPDEHTVVFELSGKWPGFPHLLTAGAGMIVAESAGEGDGFRPVGAGPFTFVRHAPREELVLAANEDYWDGRPQLDRVRMVFLNDQHTARESFDSGGVNAVFLRDPDLVDRALAEGRRGYLSLVSLGNVAVINADEGRPGADPRVRRAMHHAIDPDLVRRRAYEGAGIASNAVFPAQSRWHGDTEPLPYDPARAEELLRQARADGFDGHIRYTDAGDPASRATALTVKSALEAVGFTVELDLVRTIADQITKVSVERDYDVAGWGISWRESGPYSRMYSTLHSEGDLTVGMATGAETDALLGELKRAETPDERAAVLDEVQARWNDQVPALVYGPTAEFLVWSDRVHGVTDTANSMVLLDDAWIDGGGR